MHCSVSLLLFDPLHRRRGVVRCAGLVLALLRQEPMPVNPVLLELQPRPELLPRDVPVVVTRPAPGTARAASGRGRTPDTSEHTVQNDLSTLHHPKRHQP